MMKRTFKCVTLLIMVVTFGLSGCGKDKSELKKDLKDAKTQIEQLEKQLEEQEKEATEKISALEVENAGLKQQTNRDIPAYYLSIRFKQDGKYYKLSSDVKAYSDPGCEEQLDNVKVRMISPEIDDPERENGYTVYVGLSEEGLVFFPEYPDLIEDKPEQ